MDRAAAGFDLVAMRHRRCGRLCCAISAEVVDNPRRKILNTHVILINGDEPKAGRLIVCGFCKVPYGLTPRDIEVDRGEDHHTSLPQRVALKVAQAILG